MTLYRVSRQIIGQGLIYSLKTGYRAGKIFLHIRGHYKLVKLMRSSPYLKKLLRAQPRLIYKYLGYYLAFDLSTADRLAILTNHYSYLIRRMHYEFFNDVLRGTPVWQRTQETTHYQIDLTFPFGIDWEGDLTLIFRVNSVSVYSVAFTLLVDQPTPFFSEPAILVSRIQGAKNFDLIKQTTKELGDIVPSALLMAALQGIASACQINRIIGISNQKQLSKSDEETTFFDYDAFWHSLGSHEVNNNLFYLPVPFPEKPLTLIKANHRKRTVKKRQFKEQIMQSVCTYFQTNFLNESV